MDVYTILLGGLVVILFLTFLPGSSNKAISVKFYRSGESQPWALVTGASRGIGKEFALQLAASGYSVILMARSKTGLETVAKEINTRFPQVQTLVLPFDFAAPYDAVIYGSLKETLDAHTICILVNNVGISPDLPTPFMEDDPVAIRRMIQVNILAQLEVSRLVIPQMQKRRKGLVLNMGSMAGQVPVGCMATYSGTKAFLKNWSLALSLELEADKVHVQHLNTYFVVSDMSKIRRASRLAPTPKDYVAAVLQRLGKPRTLTPYPPHALLSFGASLLPPDFLLAYTYRMHKGIRQKALLKAARQETEKIK